MGLYIEIYAKWNVIVAYEERIFYQLIIPIVNIFVVYLIRKFYSLIKVVIQCIVHMVDVNNILIIKLNVNVNNVHPNILIKN